MAVKIDMSKAYDSVEWPFFKAMLSRLGFREKITRLLMLFVQTVRYSVVVNGKLGKQIIPSRGLRQGDPISPSMFHICAEGLSHLFKKAESEGVIKGVAVVKGCLRVNHLLFADDCVIFGKVAIEEWRNTYAILECYEKASGQKLNKHKTSIFFSKNTKAGVRDEIFKGARSFICDIYEEYLGLTAIVGRSKYNALRGLRERVGVE